MIIDPALFLECVPLVSTSVVFVDIACAMITVAVIVVEVARTEAVIAVLVLGSFLLDTKLASYLFLSFLGFCVFLDGTPEDL